MWGPIAFVAAVAFLAVIVWLATAPAKVAAKPRPKPPHPEPQQPDPEEVDIHGYQIRRYRTPTGGIMLDVWMIKMPNGWPLEIWHLATSEQSRAMCVERADKWATETEFQWIVAAENVAADRRMKEGAEDA